MHHGRGGFRTCDLSRVKATQALRATAQRPRFRAVCVSSPWSSCASRFGRCFHARFHPSAQLLAPAIAEVRAVDRARDVRVLVAQQVARLLGVVAVHRGAVAQRVEVRQSQLAALDVARGRSRRRSSTTRWPRSSCSNSSGNVGRPSGVAGALLRAVERAQDVALAERPARPRGEHERPRPRRRRRARLVLQQHQRRRARQRQRRLALLGLELDALAVAVDLVREADRRRARGRAGRGPPTRARAARSRGRRRRSRAGTASSTAPSTPRASARARRRRRCAAQASR